MTFGQSIVTDYFFGGFIQTNNGNENYEQNKRLPM